MSPKSPNRIVLFFPSLVGAGGAERLLLEEEKFLINKGIETIILTYSLNRSALYEYEPKKLELIETRCSRASRVLALRRKLKQIHPDMIISLPTADLYLATLFTSIPYVAHIHGTLFWFTGDSLKYSLIHKKVFSSIRESVIGHKEFIGKSLRCSIQRRISLEVLAILDYLAVRKALRIITLTDQLQWEIKKLYDRDALVAHGCLSEKALSYKPKENIRRELSIDGKIILSVGRLDPRKRIDVLIKSFAEIVPTYENLWLIIGGTGEEEGRLRELAEELNVAEKVKFLGFIPDSKLYDYYAACDVFAFPSWTSSGITPYEALAAGKKVVWTTEADEPILMDKHVFLAEPNMADFSRGLEEALNTNIEKVADLSDYTWDKYFETVYRAIIEATND